MNKKSGMEEIVSNPFTPKSGWEPRVFIGREKEVEIFRKKLNEAKKSRCDHFLILGEWGIGKTSLLKEFKKIAQKEGILTSLISIRKFKNTEEIIDGATQLVQDISRKLPFQIRKLTNFLKLHRLVAKNLLIKPERIFYSLPDKFFKIYIINLKGYNGEGDQLE